MKRWTIRARFLLLLVGLLLAVFVAITLIIVRQNTHTLKSNLIDQSKSFAALATQPIGDAYLLYQNSGTIHIQQQVQRFTDLDDNINQVEIVDGNAKQVFTNRPGHSIKVSQDQASAITSNYMYDSNHNLVAIVQPYVENFGIHRYTLVYGISYKSVNQNIQNIVRFIVVLSALILFVALIVWYVLINRLFLRPVAQLSQSALQISQGDLSREIRLARRDEIGDLAQAVDTMASSLKADITKLKEVDKLKNEFMMITSHNLRTPLTIINAYLEQIKSLQPPEKLRALIDIIGVNATRLGGFAEDVLTISTIEAGQNILHRQPTELKPVIETISTEFAALAKQKRLDFVSHIEINSTIKLSKAHFRSALWNLLDNAYKFTADGGTVKLTARDNGPQVEISVEDTGIGIKQSEMAHLFTKFHRGTDTMQYDYEGTGIGLYIAKLIIEQHGGHISVESHEGQGSRFLITLPTMAASSDGEQSRPAESQPQQDGLDVQGHHNEGERQQSVQATTDSEQLDGTGVSSSDTVGHDLLPKDDHQGD